MTKLFSLLVALGLAITGLAQKNTITPAGENYLDINSVKTKKQHIEFNNITGDWFINNKDGHVSLSLHGKLNNQNVRLEMETNGTAKEFEIYRNEQLQYKPHEAFFLAINEYDYNEAIVCDPDGNERIKINIEQIDDQNCKLTFSGTMCGKLKLYCSGKVSVKKNSKVSSSATYKDCDNVIKDKLVGAQDRSPTDCEIKYDLEVKSAFQKAFENVVSGFQNNHWLVTKITPLDPVTGVPRASDNSSFLGDYDIELQIDPKSDKYIELNKSFEQLSGEYGKDPSNNAKMENSQNYLHKMISAIYIKIYAGVNSTYSSMYIFKEGHKMLKAPGASYVIESPYMQSGGGGGIESSVGADFIYMGNWKAPVIVKDRNGGETINVMPVIVKSATTLSVKNVTIRIECNSELAEQILKGIDFSKLTSLLN